MVVVVVVVVLVGGHTHSNRPYATSMACPCAHLSELSIQVGQAVAPAQETTR